MQHLPLSVVINTKNAVTTLDQALMSVKPWAAEIIVVDMKSQDETRELARQNGARVYSYPDDLGYADPAREFALDKARQEWILVLDADEVIPDQLAQQLPKLIAHPTIACYFVPRQNYIFGDWLRHTGWWPDYQPRLFRRGSVHWAVGVHRMPDIVGEIEYLPADPQRAIIHHNYPTVSDYIQRLDRYTTVAAAEAERPEQASSQDPLNAAHIVQAFWSELFARFFVANGARDGVRGVALSLLQSTYQLTYQLKRWQLRGWPAAPMTEAQAIAFFAEGRSQLAFWIADWYVQHTRGVGQVWWRIRRKFRF